MKKLRKQFLLFFVLLSSALLFLLLHSYRQIDLEEKALWKNNAEKVYDQMQSLISDFLTAEDKRSAEEYKFDKNSTTPLATIPENDSKGLVGYFQIDADNNFTAPPGGRSDLVRALTNSLSAPATPPQSAISGSLSAAKKEESRMEMEDTSPQEGKYIYPNPVQEKASRLKQAQKLSPPRQTAADISAEILNPQEDVPLGFKKKALNLPQANELSRDPFQAKQVEDHLLFYRRLWKDQKTKIQGFALATQPFYDWLMDQSFANSDLPDFSVARLESNGVVLAQYGEARFVSPDSPAFFERSLGYPLHLLSWKVYADSFPQLSTRLFLHILSALLFLIVTGGLFVIYRSTAAQVWLSQKRQDFVSAITHELRTPLTSIRMYSEILENGWTGDDNKKQEYYRHIHKESGRLTRLIENVLQLARLEKKTVKLCLKEEGPENDFNEMSLDLKRLAEQQGFTLTAQTEPNLPSIRYDPEAVKQIFLSLLENSLKFCAGCDNKSLEMSLTLQVTLGENHIVWSWRDYGPGIPQGELKKVFENFYRVENEMTRRTQGTGIGLAVCRMLADEMNARLEAQNPPGGGLEVRLVFTEICSREERSVDTR